MNIIVSYNRKKILKFSNKQKIILFRTAQLHRPEVRDDGAEGNFEQIREEFQRGNFSEGGRPRYFDRARNQTDELDLQGSRQINLYCLLL